DAINIGSNDLILGRDLVVLGSGGINSLGSEAETIINGIAGLATSNANGTVTDSPTINEAAGAQIDGFNVLLADGGNVNVGLDAVSQANTLQAYFAAFVNAVASAFGISSNLPNGEVTNTGSSRNDEPSVTIQGQINLIDPGTMTV